MNSQVKETKFWKLEIQIAKLYLYLLPIHMFSMFSFLQTLLAGAAVYVDLILHVLGVILIILRNKSTFYYGTDKSSRLLQHFVKLVLYLNLSSLIMACVIQAIYGNHGAESAFSGISGMVIYFFQFALMLYYNKQIFSMLQKEEILKILRRVCLFLLILGYLQIAVMTVGGVFITIHDGLDIFGVLYSAETMPKLSLTGSEGASAGSLISIFVMPILYGGILEGDKTKSSIIQALLWLPVLYFTKSTTGYLLFVVVTIVFIILYIKKYGTSNILKGIFAILIIALIIFALSFLIPKEAIDNIRYLLLEKPFDRNNGSTISRTVPFVVNWGAFTEFPVFGVGNGLQGYFYEKYFPDWAYNVAGSDVMDFLEISKEGISNGGIFFPSILSGYGIVGVTLIVIFIVRLLNHAKQGKNQMGIFYYVFILASIAFIVTGFQSELNGIYYMWFMISLPLMIKPTPKVTSIGSSINETSKN